MALIGDDAHVMLSAAVSTRNVVLITDTLMCINELVEEIQHRFCVALKPGVGKSMSLSCNIKKHPSDMAIDRKDKSYGDSEDEFRSHLQTGVGSKKQNRSGSNASSPPATLVTSSANERAVSNSDEFWQEPVHSRPLTGHSVDAIADSLQTARSMTMEPESMSGSIFGHKHSVHKCPMCPKQFSKAFQLNLHLVRHQNPNGFPCKICSKVFSDNGNRLRHERICRSQNESAMIRPGGDSSQQTQSSDIQARQLGTSPYHSGEKLTFSEPPRPASRGQAEQTSRSQLEQMSRGRTPTKQGASASPNQSLPKQMYDCRRCGKIFTDHSNRLRHERKCTTSGQSSQSAISTPVSVIEPSPGKRKSHTSLELPISVNNFKSAASTAEPVRVFDDSGRAVSMYSCRICAKLLQTRVSLEMHYMSHLGIKPHACGYCPKRFTDPSNWRKHQKKCSERIIDASDDSGPPTMVPPHFGSSRVGLPPTQDDSNSNDAMGKQSSQGHVKSEPIDITLSDKSDGEGELDSSSIDNGTSEHATNMEVSDSLLVEYNQTMGSSQVARTKERFSLQPAAKQVSCTEGDDQGETPDVVVDSGLSWFVNDNVITALTPQDTSADQMI